MTAILLAAGVGRRMGPGAGPKCLIEVGGKTLLARILESLRSVGVAEAVLVVGFGKEEVIREARARAGGMRLTVIENERYREGAILSLWSARAFLDRPVLVMDTDVLVSPAAYERLVGSRHANCLLVDAKAPDTGEEQMVFGREGRVLHITKRPPDELRQRMERYGESVGFLKLSEEGAHLLRQLLEEKVRAGITQIEHEQVYPELFEKTPVSWESMDGIAWTEIDTPADQEKARDQIYPQWKPTPCLNRQIAGWFLPWVIRLPITPNQWTFLGLFLGLGAAACAAEGTRRADVTATVLFQLFTLTDDWDGEVARLRGQSTRWGGWFDPVVDMVVQVALVLGLAAGVQRAGGPGWAMALGAAAALGIALDFLITLWAKARGFGPTIFGDPSRGVGTGGAGWLKNNLTHENFSLLVVAVLLLGAKLPFLFVLAVGCQVFWIRYFWKERARL